MSTTLFRRAGLAALLVAFGAVPAARTAAAQATQSPQPAAAPQAAEDPLRRETPRGAFMGFVEASQSGNRAQAAEYLQWPREKMPIDRQEAAAEFRFVLNHGFEGNLDRISRNPAGDPNDGLPADRERVGTAVLSNGERVDLYLARVTQPSGPALWLIASETVLEIPRMYEHAGLPELERRLPRFMTSTNLGGLQLWVPIAMLLLLPALYALSWVFLRILLGVARLVLRLRGRSVSVTRSRSWKALGQPTTFLLTLGLHRVISPQIGVPLLHRQYYSRTVTVLLLAGVVWWLWHLVDLLTERMRDRLLPYHPRTAQSIYVLGRRLLKGVAVAIALLAGLASFGVDLTTTLAGLGIGGIALAFASQKTLENVFGGIFVLSDRSIVVGDVCQIGKYVGEVMDVGLRSMQLRTINRTVVYVPNGTLATMEVENLSRRDKFLFNPVVGLRYETTLEQIQRVANDTKAMLTTDSRVENSTLRVRLIRFGAYSLDVEVFAYVMAADYAAFLAVQEELLMRIMGIVKYAGTGLAFPSQTMYVRNDTPAPPPFQLKAPG
jgi:MscS family membrane protein